MIQVNDNKIQVNPMENLKVKICKKVFNQILAESQDSLKKGIETGGYLAGIKNENSIVIEAFTGPGPNAERTSCYYKPDYVYAARVLKELKEKKGYLLIGDSHIHLSKDMGLSEGDMKTIEGLKLDGVFHDLIYLLVNITEDSSLLRFYQYRDNVLVELEYEIIEDTNDTMDFSRVSELYNHELLAKKRVLVVGLGSGGSLLAWYLARTGIGYLGLLDGERLEKENLVRHICGIKDIGKLKTKYMESIIKSINPLIKIKTYTKNISEDDYDFLKATLPKYDLVINCTGDPLTSNLINRVCFELKIPSIHSGVFPKAEGGFVLQVIPDNSCCYNCIYDHSKLTISDTEAYRNELRNRYGISENQLSAHQGLFVDISFVTLLEAKVALLTLLGEEDHHLGRLKGNLILWNNKNFTCHVIQAKRKEDCAVCNYQNWLNS